MRNVIVVMDWFDDFEKLEEFYTEHHDKIRRVVNLKEGTEFIPSAAQGGIK